MPSKDTLHELVLLTEIKRDLEAQLAELSPRMEKLKEEVRQQFIDEGIGSTTVLDDDGSKRATVFTMSQRMPHVADPKKFKEFALANNLEHLYTVNTKSLQGFVNKELKDIAPAAYEDLQSIGVEAFEVKTVVVRKA